eukprot:jgi/Psemu1/301875/fgenesh1_kg.50_\
MMKSLVYRGRQLRVLVVLVAILVVSLCSLKCAASDNNSGSSLENLWDIINPIGKKCLVGNDAKEDQSSNDDTHSTVCEDASSAIRMEYKIHKNAKYPKYQLYQKECGERFEIGTEPVRGTTSPDTDHRIPLSMSPGLDGEDFVTASIELLPNKDYLSPSWFQRLTSTEKQQLTVEFCVRMSLWTAPDRGNVEVNFRDTNVVITFNTTATNNNDNGRDIVVDSFELEQKKLLSAHIEIKGSSAKVVSEEKDEVATSTEKNDEL